MSAANPPPSPQGDRIDPDKLTFIWGMEPLPIADTPAHFFVAGGVASGKTITLRLLMQSVLPHIGLGLDHRALVYDALGNMESLLRGMDLGCPLHILNPFDRRGAAWDIAADIASPSAAQQLAACLIPTVTSDDPFFADAARQLLVAVCLSFIKTVPGTWTLRDVLLALRNRERLVSVLTRTPEAAAVVQPYTKDERLCAGVLSTIAAKLEPLEVIAACWQHAPQKLSLEQWLREESVILLGDDPVSHHSLAPINQAIFGRLASLVLSQQHAATRRTWIVLDEFCRVGRVNELPVLLHRGRSQGVCVALGLAEVEEVQRLYGPQAAEELFASCSHGTALRTQNPAMAAWAERHFGPPLRASALMSLPLPSPADGFSAFHRTPKTGTHFAHKSWDWVLANLRPPKEGAPSGEPRSADDRHLRDWTDEDYRRLKLGRPPSP